jgi:hypothetical protein
MPTSQLGELKATERVLARYSKGPPARKMASDRPSATATDAAAVDRYADRPRASQTDLAQFVGRAAVGNHGLDASAVAGVHSDPAGRGPVR